MTEEEWLGLTRTTHSLMDFISERASDRKRRLYAVACCYRIWSSLDPEFLRDGIRAAECLADGQVTDSEVVELRRVVDEAAGTHYEWSLSAKRAVKYALATDGGVNGMTSGAYAAAAMAFSATNGKNNNGQFYRIELEENEEQIRLVLRDIFGNPFRPITILPEWLTSTVLTLANGIYDEKAFDRMPILGDALQDAGCDNDDILNHCRRPGEHVRGCWVVDLLLGRH